MQFTDAALAMLTIPAGKSESFPGTRPSRLWDQGSGTVETLLHPISSWWPAASRESGDIRRITLADARKIARRRFDNSSWNGPGRGASSSQGRSRREKAEARCCG